MELAFVLLFVLLGTGAIVYAGLRPPMRKPEPAPVEDAAGDAAAPEDKRTEGGAGEGP